MVGEALLVEARLLLFDDQHGLEFVCGNFIERQLDAEFQCGSQIECPAQKLPGLGRLRSIEAIERAAVAAATLWGVRAKRRITQLLAPQRPVDQVAQGGPFGPLPA